MSWPGRTAVITQSGVVECPASHPVLAEWGAPSLCESSLLLFALGALVGTVLPAQLPEFSMLRVLLGKSWWGSQTQWLRVGPVGSAICPGSGWRIPQPTRLLELIAFTLAIHGCRTGR